MDIRYAFRTLARNPGFATVAILVLALGVGVTTAIFSIVNAALIRPLPYHDPAGLVALTSAYQGTDGIRTFPTVSLNEVERWRRESTSLESIGSFVFAAFPARVNSQALFLVAIGADPELLRTLGVSPAMGRGFEGGGSTTKDSSVIISHRLWTGAFHGDPEVIGKPVVMSGAEYVVAGVLPATFQFPRSDASYFTEDPDLIIPIANIADSWGRDTTQWFAIARLNPSATIARAETELRAITARMAASTPGMQGTSVVLSPLGEETARSVRRALLLTLGIGVVLLLIACTNVMNLLFSRAAQRVREMAVRQAVGASTRRLIRQMLTETACLTFVAGGVGVFLAYLSLGTLVAFIPARLPLTGAVEIDWTVLAFAFLVCTAASIISGLLPALHPTRGAFTPLAAGARSSRGRGLLRLQNASMAAQIALGVGLMAAGGLLAHSLYRLSSVDPGFRTRDTVGFELAFPGGPAEDAVRVHDRILEAVRNTPGVISAGWITNLPPETRAGYFAPFWVPRTASGPRPYCSFQVSSEGYFAAAGIALQRGRDFARADTASAHPVAIVNESLARQFFGGGDPIGRRIGVMDAEREIIGVIRDIHDRGLDARPVPTVFVPYRQFAFSYGGVLARIDGSVNAILPELRRRVTLAEPGVPLKNLGAIQSRLHQTMDTARFYAVVAVVCAVMAVLFVTLGLYGVVSYSVARRTSEIGIRMALGAPRASVLHAVLWHGLKLAAAGILMGLALSVAGTRLLRTLLFEIQPVDPLTLALAAAIVVSVTLAASYLPARRASRIEPVVALRHE